MSKNHQEIAANLVDAYDASILAASALREATVSNSNAERLLRDVRSQIYDCVHVGEPIKVFRIGERHVIIRWTFNEIFVEFA